MSNKIKKIYHAAIYVRLSKEDGDVSSAAKAESNSISNQKNLIRDFLKDKEDIEVVSERVDDGYSGSNFSRPGVQALISAAKSGSIQMVVVKDFSRFGRDYLEVGRFLEYIFPILQVRFVSVNDNYDSSDKFGTTGGMSVALKNLVYGMYSADLSRKIRTARDTRVRNGEFVGQFAPYGYKKDPEDRHKLMVDENVAWVVRKIFQMAADGISQAEIARRLNEEEIPSRVTYHRQIGDTYGDRQPHIKSKMWCGTSVRDILTDEVYLGTLIWNRVKCGMDTDKKVVNQPREKWIVVEKNHEPLVSQELFEKANARITDKGKRVLKKRNSLFVCGYCGKVLQPRKGADRKLFCRGRTQERENACQKISIRQKELEDVVLCQVKAMADMLMQAGNMHKKVQKNDQRSVLATMVTDSTKEMARWKETKVRLYEQYKMGLITRERYLARIEQGRDGKARTDHK